MTKNKFMPEFNHKFKKYLKKFQIFFIKVSGKSLRANSMYVKLKTGFSSQDAYFYYKIESKKLTEVV